MLRILKAELDLAVAKPQLHLTEIYLFLKYFYMPGTTEMKKRSQSWALLSRDIGYPIVTEVGTTCPASGRFSKAIAGQE